MKLQEGMKVCICVKALYDRNEDLFYGAIVPVPNFAKSSNACDYYDLCNEDGEVACLDGEEVTVDQVGVVLVTFRNDNGEGTVYFALTHEEAEAAILK